MRASGSNEKGAKFERDVAKDLSLCISNGKRKDVLWRSSQSGGRATQALKSGENLAAQAGDLVAVHEDGMQFASTFVVECKHRKDMGFYNLIVNNKGPLYNYWVKLNEEALSFGKSPMLIFKENRRRVLVGLHANEYRILFPDAVALGLATIDLDDPMFLIGYTEFLKCSFYY